MFFRAAGALGLGLRLVGRRQFVAFREVVPRKRWMFSQNFRCSHRELDFSTDRSKTDGGSYAQVRGDRKVDAMGGTTDEAKEAQEFLEHLNSLGTEENRSELLVRVLLKLPKLVQQSILEKLEKSVGSEREQNAEDVEEQAVDDVDVQNLPGVQSESGRWMRNVVVQAEKGYKRLFVDRGVQADKGCRRLFADRGDQVNDSAGELVWEEDDRLYLYYVISSLHERVIREVEIQRFRKMRAGAKVRLRDWKEFSREMRLEGGRGPVTEFFHEFLQDGGITRDTWETLQRIWTGKEAAPDCTAQKRHGRTIECVISDPIFSAPITDPILQAVRANAILMYRQDNTPIYWGAISDPIL